MAWTEGSISLFVRLFLAAGLTNTGVRHAALNALISLGQTGSDPHRGEFGMKAQPCQEERGIRAQKVQRKFIEWALKKGLYQDSTEARASTAG